MKRQRRFEEAPKPEPGSVRGLGADHPAVLMGHPLFETTVVDPMAVDRVLIPGTNNRKIGRVVTKGAWKGFPIYTLTLPERTTCPRSCPNWGTCYGNAMPFAQRHAPGAHLEQCLWREVGALAGRFPRGFVVRLHVLGDFYSLDYVKQWGEMLKHFPALHVYGYTALGTSQEPNDVTMADELRALIGTYGKRFSLRFSTSEMGQPNSVLVIDREPEASVVPEGTVCPAERDKTACCATCGLCWSGERTIVFVRHGLGQKRSRVMAANLPTGTRRIKAIEKLRDLAGKIATAPPRLMWIDPRELWVDPLYQRDVSGNGVLLIQKIVAQWSWVHFKPPIVAHNAALDRFELIDGQHTAIAAATHPGIEQIPVMIVSASECAERARAFISHNGDRIAVTPAQQHFAAIAAKDPAAIEVAAACEAAGVKILAFPPSSGFASGDTMALATIRKLVKQQGRSAATSVLAAVREADCVPIRTEQIRASARLLLEPPHHSRDSVISALKACASSHDAVNALRRSTHVPAWEALAIIMAQWIVAQERAEAAE